MNIYFGITINNTYKYSHFYLPLKNNIVDHNIVQNNIVDQNIIIVDKHYSTPSNIDWKYGIITCTLHTDCIIVFQM